MRNRDAAPAFAAKGTLTQSMRSAALWKTPRSSLITILSVETLCVTWLAVTVPNITPNWPDFGRFAMLVGLAVVYAEGNARVDRLTRFVGLSKRTQVGTNAASLWCFVAALVLPIGLAGTFAVLFWVHAFVLARRSRAGQPYRLIYTANTEVLATLLAASVISAFGHNILFGSTLKSVVAAIVAIVAYSLVNQGLIALVVYTVRRPVSVIAVLVRPAEEATELAPLALGVLFAVALTFTPYLAPFSLVVIVVLRRSLLVRQLQEQASRDAKTGLLNAGAWRHEAEREFARAERTGASATVLMVDLDHFKRLNDEHGHQAGDEALRAVASAMQDALRGYDAVGRFGGEEFVALLADADAGVSAAVAERVRVRIAGLRLAHGGGVTASIGVGIGACDVTSLDELIAVADKAMYVAKRSGRDQVHVATTTELPSLAVGRIGS